jgi:hypothetical protein
MITIIQQFANSITIIPSNVKFTKMFPTASQKMLIIPTTHKMPAPNYNPQHNFKVCKFKQIWLSPTSIPRTSLSKITHDSTPTKM